MGVISNFIARARERKDRERELEEDNRIVGRVEEKKLSHNERELVKRLEAERQTAIKDALYWDDRNRRAKERLAARQMMTFDSNMFQNDNILSDNRNFLLGGNG